MMSGTGGCHVENRSILAIRERLILLACDAKTDEDKQGLSSELASTWTQAARQERESPPVDHDSQYELIGAQLHRIARVSVRE